MLSFSSGRELLIRVPPFSSESQLIEIIAQSPAKAKTLGQMVGLEQE